MASTYLSFTPSSTGNQRTFTFSFWVKRSKLGLGGTGQVIYCQSYGSDGYQFKIEFTSNDEFRLYNSKGASDAINLKTSKLFKDTSSWYAITIQIDTTQSTASDRAKIYVNGVQETSFGSATYPTQNLEMDANAAAAQIIGAKYSGSYSTYFNGSLSHFYFVDGTAYAASTFGSTDSTTTGQWKINTSPTVTYGTNGFFILKDGNSVTDQSGNSNNFTVGGGTLTKTEDCPSNVFSTLNPLGYASASFTLIEGNLYSGGADNNWRSIFGTIGSSSGKYYYEVKIISTANEHIGIASADQMANCSGSTGKFTDNSYGAEGYSYTNGGQKANNGNEVNWGNSYTTNDIIGVAFDLDNSKLYFSKNGTWQESGDPTSGATGTGAAFTLVANKIYLPAMASYGAASNMAFNFGNGYFRTTAISSAGTNASGIGIFEYDVPTGYTALSTKGLNL